MDGLQEQRARKLVNHLERTGSNCGLLIVQRTVVIRCSGAPYNDTPTMFDESDLQNAIALNAIAPK